jgi:hypothetical protein
MALEDMLLAPSETLVELRRVGHDTWMRSDSSPASALKVAASISTDVGHTLPTADWKHVGWAIFTVGTQVLLKDKAFAGHVRRAIPPAQVLLGVQRGAQLTCRVGDALIDRGERPAGTRSQQSTFEVGESLLQGRSRLVRAAESVLAQLLPGAELLASFDRAIRGPVDEPNRTCMMTNIVHELPGIDAAQAGWGLVVCGSSLLSLANEAAPESQRRRWLPSRRSQEGADLLGTALVGAVDVIAGDAWIRSAPSIARRDALDTSGLADS